MFQLQSRLSATPINNSLEDLWAIVSVLLPRIGFEGARDVFRDPWAKSHTRVFLEDGDPDS